MLRAIRPEAGRKFILLSKFKLFGGITSIGGEGVGLAFDFDGVIIISSSRKHDSEDTY
ncbi:MAG: hypothetical protein OXH57_07180 [Ekhidna sp.]|nr:hypothetical protein [Ekhidna sp.]